MLLRPLGVTLLHGTEGYHARASRISSAVNGIESSVVDAAGKPDRPGRALSIRSMGYRPGASVHRNPLPRSRFRAAAVWIL